jgi:hypothetical protein
MSFSIGSNNPISQIFNNNTSSTPAPQTTTASPTAAYSSDAVNVSNTYANPDKAGAFKKLSNSIGEAFSNVADKMGIGETYKVIEQEFNQVDLNKDQSLNQWEFNVATMNLGDIFGTEFARADKNRDGRVQTKEYVEYRKDQLGRAFDQKDSNNDSHVSMNEIGSIGKMLLEKRDPRLDENQDGLVNKREFMRSSVKGSISIRDFLGF